MRKLMIAIIAVVLLDIAFIVISNPRMERAKLDALPLPAGRVQQAGPTLAKQVTPPAIDMTLAPQAGELRDPFAVPVAETVAATRPAAEPRLQIRTRRDVRDTRAANRPAESLTASYTATRSGEIAAPVKLVVTEFGKPVEQTPVKKHKKSIFKRALPIVTKPYDWLKAVASKLN